MKKLNYENEQIKVTTPENQPSKNTDTRFWQRSLLMNGLGWLGAIALLGSSSMIWVQNPQTGIAVAAPNIPEIMPKAVPDSPAPAAKKEPDPVFIRRTPNPAPTRARTRSQNRVSQTRNSRGNNTSSYIDPTDYSIGATNRQDLPGGSYQPPSAVVFRERSKPRQRVVREQFSIEEPSADIATVRPRVRVRRNAVTARRRQSSPAQVSRAPRTYEIERRTNSTQVSRARRSYEIERVTPEPSNSRISRRRSNEQAENTQVARTTRRRNTTVAAANQVKVGPIKVTPNGIRMSRSGVIRRGETRIASTNINGLGDSGNNQTARNRVLNYYYNSVKPSESSDNESNRTNLAMIFPLAIPAQITSMFGWRIHPITGEKGFHAGTDIGAPMGTPVLAAHAGRVALADFLGGYGLAVVLRHNQDAQETRYGHLSEVTVKPGDWVEQGTVIGRVGDSGNTNGPHLHFEVREQTPQGWVAKDPGVQLEYSLARLIRAFQSGQATLPQDVQPYEMPANTLQVEKLSPQVPVPSAELPVIAIPGTEAPPPLFSSGE
ncbi:M23 family metallopeptidase [Aerosakkonemataceae cyanobacterium BLCC-F154]|uniref:M23 family metallopeptidase n=1 Tax=Floridaenema fluviatile BLCC-F154 TaxID=3153640 RepID=A0ABV4YDD1_9CYAN